MGTWEQHPAPGWGMCRGLAPLCSPPAWPSCHRIQPHGPFFLLQMSCLAPMAPETGSTWGLWHPGKHRLLSPCLGFPWSEEGAPPVPVAGEGQREPLGASATRGSFLCYWRAGGNRAAPAAASHARPGHCTTIGFAAALPFTAWKLNCKMSKTFPNCAILAWFY